MEKKVYLIENVESSRPKWWFVVVDDIFPYMHFLTASNFFNIRSNIKCNFKNFCNEKGYIQGNCF